MITIKQVKKEQIINLRHDILREGQPVKNADFEGEDKKGTIHLGYFDENEKIVGCVTMLVTARTDLESIPQYRLRGMAVDKQHQNKLVGTALIKMAEFTALNNEVSCIWLNARQNAVDFYLKQGFKIKGQPFEIESIGTHFQMVKYIKEQGCNCCGNNSHPNQK